MDHTKTIFIQNVWESLDSKPFILTPQSSTSSTVKQNSKVLPPIKFSKRITRIGTHTDNDLCLSESSVSRYHAYIEVDDFGHKIVDQNSKNGVFLNGIRIKEAYLQSGIHIHLGSTHFVYQLLEDENVQHIVSKRNSFGQLIGQSKAMREVFALLERCSASDMTVLIEGSSGTGKELAAQALHQYSPRDKKGKFIVFDCSSVPSNLIESELFGHKKGAFTGASQDREGAFSRAEGGTLFLDEIGELPLELQSRLLRALEKQEIKSVGADEYIRVNVRVLAATNRNLKQEVEQGNFRLDLYYRLAVLKIKLPSLKHHKEDIPFLVQHFIKELSPHTSQEVSYETMMRLQDYEWEGNVRELKNFVSRALAMTLPHESQINEHYLLPTQLREISVVHTPSTKDTSNATQSLEEGKVEHDSTVDFIQNKSHRLSLWMNEEISFKEAKASLIEDFESIYWSRLLAKTNDNVSAAARIAQIHRKSAEYLLKKLNLKKL